ncbi:type I-G CRISPR-associated RAMP protein Csb1/Cas7g [Ornithinimicrobium sp. Y1847]|uniref:type I-G CRISPR-associated RAMP protein Csb1/Cas7g n=1 Tax=Ornithinimicrobium sp. Y1847 TaxID=3405419 RepID=UPI003B68574B
MTNRFIEDVAKLIDDPRVAGLRSHTTYESALARTVTPPAGTLRSDGRDVEGEFELPDGTKAVTLDTWGSQASRMESAIEQVADDIGYPLIRFVDEEGALLTTSVRLSHRHADATWRAARKQLEGAGIPFLRLRDVTAQDASLLLRWFPTAPIFGWWHSHTANAQKEAKKLEKYDKETAEAFAGYARVHADSRSARLVTSEIVATDVHRRVRRAARVDTLFGPLKSSRSTGSAKSDGPSALGLGSLPPVEFSKAPIDVSYGAIEGTWFLSLTGLRRFGWGANPKIAQALVVALALLLRELTRLDGRLRAGTELIAQTNGQIQVVGHGMEAVNWSDYSLGDLMDVVRELGASVGWDGPVDVVIPADSVLGGLFKTADREAGETDPS